MKVREVQVKGILSKSKVYDYVINPYTGCQHGCSYCYARFMKRFTGHTEPWGEFVDVKINAAELLQKEILKKKPGRVWVSGVCDPYQPLEAKYKLTWQCLMILVRHEWPITIQTRSPLVLRDADLFRNARDLSVNVSITTADDKIRKLFEPEAPPVNSRIETVEKLHQAGIHTVAMIAPMLPGAEGLPRLLQGKVDSILIDRLNYHYANWIYKKYGLEDKMSDGYFSFAGEELAAACRDLGLDCRSLY
jgi:DNA repair photolyase